MEKKYKLKKCPKCGMYDKIGVIIGEKNLWSCGCGWIGKNPETIEVTASEYIKFAEDLE